MGRLVLAALLPVLLAVALTGCAQAPESGEPTGDGLHLIVPDVLGLDETEAAEALDDVGYQVGDITVQQAPDVEPGIVIGQDPIPGTSAPRDAAVDLIIAEP